MNLTPDPPAGPATPAQARKNEAIALLSRGVAHDFNNLLTVTILNIELVLMDTTLSPKAQTMLQNAHAGAKRATELTAKLQAFSRLTVPKLAVLDLVSLTGEVLPHVLARSGAKVQSVFSPAVGSWMVSADRQQIQLALTHLLQNACEAMPEGGELTVGIENLPAGAKPAGAPDGEFVRVTIADTGVGLSPDSLAHLRERGYPTKKIGKGTGLGLAMAHTIVGDHGGWMTLESELGKGTTVSLHLPLASGAAG